MPAVVPVGANWGGVYQRLIDRQLRHAIGSAGLADESASLSNFQSGAFLAAHKDGFGRRCWRCGGDGEGGYSYYEDKRVFAPACKLGGVIETTGTWDTFCASVLNFVLEHGLDGLAVEDLSAMLRFANTAAYWVTTKKGAIRSMPEQKDVGAIL